MLQKALLFSTLVFLILVVSIYIFQINLASSLLEMKKNDIKLYIYEFNLNATRNMFFFWELIYIMFENCTMQIPGLFQKTCLWTLCLHISCFNIDFITLFTLLWYFFFIFCSRWVKAESEWEYRVNYSKYNLHSSQFLSILW